MTGRWRDLASYILLLGIGGLLLELLLLEHHEDPWQWTPIVLLASGLVVTAACVVRPSAPLVRAQRALMATYLAAATLGIFFHLRANVEFELELRPSMAGLQLVIETLKGAMPALAPGAMAQLGLLGLLVTWKHPALNRRTPEDEGSA